MTNRKTKEFRTEKSIKDELAKAVIEKLKNMGFSHVQKDHQNCSKKCSEYGCDGNYYVFIARRFLKDGKMETFQCRLSWELENDE